MYAAVADVASFDRAQVLADLTALRVSPTDVVDLCIPQVATWLGEDWVEDRMTFAQVTSASARLFGLCKTLGQDWNNVRPALNARALLIATLDHESHIIGPAVLTDQLRRRGHSVQLHSNATGETLIERMSQDNFHAVLLSVSTWQALESASKAIREIRQEFKAAFIVLGGAVLNEDGFDLSLTDADMTTNNIDAALDAITGDDIALKVAE